MPNNVDVHRLSSGVYLIPELISYSFYSPNKKRNNLHTIRKYIVYKWHFIFHRMPQSFNHHQGTKVTCRLNFYGMRYLSKLNLHTKWFHTYEKWVCFVCFSVPFVGGSSLPWFRLLALWGYEGIWYDPSCLQIIKAEFEKPTSE
jgi:hypothetical protein